MSEPERPAVMAIKTSRFGLVEVAQDQVLTLPHGMVGFPHLTRYLLLKHREGSPFHWLQAVDNPDLAFVVMNPLIFEPTYEITLGSAEAKLLEVSDPKQIQVWVVVTIPHGAPENMTANLKAPLVVNLANRRAAQVILEDPKYPLRHPMKK